MSLREEGAPVSRTVSEADLHAARCEDKLKRIRAIVTPHNGCPLCTTIPCRTFCRAAAILSVLDEP